jgi:hypothetical protein
MSLTAPASPIVVKGLESMRVRVAGENSGAGQLSNGGRADGHRVGASDADDRSGVQCRRPGRTVTGPAPPLAQPLALSA